MRNHFTLSDLRGLGQLALGATEQITDLVEEMHWAIASPFSMLGPSMPGRTRGITGLVYSSIHASYGLVGSGVNAVLGPLAELFDQPATSPEREALLAVLNGMWGDHLAASRNPLAIEMSLRRSGRSIVLQKAAIQAEIPEASGKVLVLVHGLSMNDLGWLRGGHDHGAALARDLSYTSLYLHYNTGLHISTNGRTFASLLEMLIEAWPQPLEELVLIGHSMGGLVARSACHYGALAGYAWPGHLRKLVCLGTPHHGSWVERAGAWIDESFRATRYTAPFRRLGTHRSAGITDLRYGNLLDEDWQGLDRFGSKPDHRSPVPLPAGVRRYVIGATLGAIPGDVKGRLLGDGVVPLDSALGLHKDAVRRLAVPPERQWIGYDMGHLDLLDRPEVYERISQWLRS